MDDHSKIVKSGVKICFFFQKRVNRQSWITRSSEKQVNTQSQQCHFLLIDRQTVNILDLPVFFFIIRWKLIVLPLMTRFPLLRRNLRNCIGNGRVQKPILLRPRRKHRRQYFLEICKCFLLLGSASKPIGPGANLGLKCA